MKACILSMQKVDNMGSVLQAYGLKKILESEGYEVEFIDIKRIDEDYMLLGGYTQKFLSETEKVGFIGKLRKIDKFFLNRFRIKKLVKTQSSYFDHFRKDELKIDKKSLKYDLCVIGSDEVFNCLNAGYWGFSSQLFGNVPEANMVITYAASCGSTSYSLLPETVSYKIKDTFNKISAFSVRDKNTLDFVSNLTNSKVNENFDPVLICDFHKEIDNIILPDVPKKYCIVYSYYNRIYKRNEINKICEFCDQHDLTAIAIGAPQFWLKNYVICTPFQCLKLFQKADFVITDTFHGTIFSAKYADKYAIIIRESNKHKLEDLVRRIDVSSHVIENIEELNRAYKITDDKNLINNIIEIESEKAVSYFNSNLSIDSERTIIG